MNPEFLGSLSIFVSVALGIIQSMTTFIDNDERIFVLQYKLLTEMGKYIWTVFTNGFICERAFLPLF